MNILPYKKALFLGVLVVFAATSVAPAAFAQSGGNLPASNSGSGGVGQATPSMVKELKEKQDRARELRERADQLRVRALREVQNLNLPSAAAKRPLPPAPPKLEKRGPSNERVLQAKRFDEALGNFKSARNLLRTDTSNIEHWRQYLTHLIDTLIERGRKLEERVKEHPIRETLEETILKEIEADRAALEALKVEVQSAKTLEELKAIWQKIQDQHRDFTNRKARLLMLLWYLGRLEKTHSERLSLRAEKIDARLDELERGGQDVSKFRELLKQATDLIAAVQTTIKEEKTKLIGTEVSEVKLKEIKEIIEALHRKLNQVQKIFKEIQDGIANL